jgi:hypothetical protein
MHIAILTSPFYYFKVDYLTMLLVSKLCSIADRIINECGEVDGMRIGRGNRKIREKTSLMPLFPPQISHDLSWDRTRTALVETRLLIV